MQAVSHLVEGIEPRKKQMGRTTFWHRRKTTWAQPRWPGCARFPGVLDHGMHDTAISRQPGRPYARFQGGERVPTTFKREEGLIVHRESDRLVVPVKGGNSPGGKEATHGRAM